MRPGRLVLVLMLVVMLSGCATAPALPERGGFAAREIVADGIVRRYQVFLPSRAAAGAKPAVILFLHGSGERGDDNAKQLAVGLGPHVRAHADAFPAIVVFPQAPDGSEWTQSAGPIAFAALDAAVREFGGDPDRIYLTGLSMGGYGAWELALQQPDRFAALVPICGGVTVDWTDRRPGMQVHSALAAAEPFAETARRLRALPTWIFHGDADASVPPAQSRRMYAALQAQDAADVRYTEFPGVGHFSWDPAYATPELWTWLFAQKRR